MRLSYASWKKLVFELKAQALTFSYSLTISLTHPKMSWEKFGNIVCMAVFLVPITSELVAEKVPGHFQTWLLRGLFSRSDNKRITYISSSDFPISHRERLDGEALNSDTMIAKVSVVL